MDLFDKYDRISRLSEAVITHESYKAVTDRIQECHDYSRNTKRPSYLLVLGDSGVGKTTILTSYAKKRARIELEEKTLVPALFVEMPGSPSLEAAVDAFLEAYDPCYCRRREKQADKTRRLIRLITEAQTEIILVDELHNYVAAANKNQKSLLTNWFKSLMNRVPVSIIGAGTPDVLNLLDGERQLKSRMTAEVWLSPFSIETDDEFRQFQRLLYSVEEILGFPQPSFLHKAEMAQRIFYACDGVFRALFNLISNAILIAEQTDAQLLGMEILHEAFKKTFSAQTQDSDNPFSNDFYPRRLINIGEAHGPRRLPS